ncbi:MAG TPA: peroxiredoxin [Rhizobiaceae bacterium]|nr:peroxiredoxin [Rhizobiaceae bacterium]
MAELKVGRKAPQFSLPGDPARTLADLAGSPVVVFFYPQDDTETCTIEATDFSALSSEFGKLGAIVVGISPDSAESHAKFTRKYGLKQLLVPDTDLKLAKAYGVWAEKTLFGRTYMGIVRTTFLIGRDGKIARIWPKVRVKDHAKQVLAAVKAL